MASITRILTALHALTASAFFLISCADQLALPDDGKSEETTPEALVGQPIQIGNALAASAVTRAGGTVVVDGDFPQVGNTMTVFLTIPAADTPDGKPRRLQANYTCTHRTYDDATHTVTSATWTADDANGNKALCWQYAGARHIFAAISPAQIPLTEYPVNNADGTVSPLPAATFTLPTTFNEQNYELWRSLCTTYQPYIVDKPTTAPIALKMRKALTEVELACYNNNNNGYYRNAILYQVPRTAFFNPTTGEVTALRDGITATLSSGDGAAGHDFVPDYTIGGNLSKIGNITAYAADALGLVHHALLLPTAYYENSGNRCDGSGTLSYILTDDKGDSHLYKNDISAGMDADGTPANDGGFCPGSVLQIMSSLYTDNNSVEKLIRCDGTYAGGTKIINKLNAWKKPEETTGIYSIFLTGPLGEREQEIMQALADMAQAKGTDAVYVEQAHEITDGLFKDSEIADFFFPNVITVGSSITIDTEDVSTVYIPSVKKIASDAFSGCNISELYLSGTDENGSFFLPEYNKDETTQITKLYLLNLPQDYFKAASEGGLLDDELQEQLEKCMEFIGTDDDSNINTGETDFGS